MFIYQFVFFFFKQKTAYEMRISDWSSDVCSSDLHYQCVKAGNDGRLGGRKKASDDSVENDARHQKCPECGAAFSQQLPQGRAALLGIPATYRQDVDGDRKSVV